MKIISNKRYNQLVEVETKYNEKNEIYVNKDQENEELKGKYQEKCDEILDKDKEIERLINNKKLSDIALKKASNKRAIEKKQLDKEREEKNLKIISLEQQIREKTDELNKKDKIIAGNEVKLTNARNRVLELSKEVNFLKNKKTPTIEDVKLEHTRKFDRTKVVGGKNNISTEKEKKENEK